MAIDTSHTTNDRLAEQQRSATGQLARRVAVLLLAGVATFGCGYNVRPMHPAHVRTVYVPMAQSNTYRRNLEFRLTESLIKEIEEKTPYKVVSDPSADTMLEARILSVKKRALNETPTDELRNVELNLFADVSWTDLRSGEPITGPAQIPLPGLLQRVAQSTDFVPEIGESFATSSQEAIDNLAEQIVAMMEEPW